MSDLAEDGTDAIAGWPNAALEVFAPVLQASLAAKPQLDDATLNTLGEARARRLQAQLLANRGVAPAAMRDFLRGDWRADPTLTQLPVFRSAVARLRRAIDAREHITVFGDYDCDGMTTVQYPTAGACDPTMCSAGFVAATACGAMGDFQTCDAAVPLLCAAPAAQAQGCR